MIILPVPYLIDVSPWCNSTIISGVIQTCGLVPDSAYIKIHFTYIFHHLNKIVYNLHSDASVFVVVSYQVSVVVFVPLDRSNLQ